MTKRTQIKKHIHTIEEIANIMMAMKNLAWIEMNKINNLTAVQNQLVNTTIAVGQHFFTSHPEFLQALQQRKPSITILIGSERGFCGEYNQKIVDFIMNNDLPFLSEHKIIVIGEKLASKLSEKNLTVTKLPGPQTADEIPDVVLAIIQLIETITTNHLDPFCEIIFSTTTNGQILPQSFRPILQFKEALFDKQAPILNVSPTQFLFEYIEQYLFTMLHWVCYQTVMAENSERFHHLELALDHIKKKINVLNTRMNFLRQEEITQEIQTIMLSKEAILNIRS